jgi:DNA-directed RNA polymerase specialized sigma24 family protein
MLSEPAFLEAIHEAIQNYTRTDRLFDSPLLQARIVTDRLADEAPTAERTAMLQRIIREQVEALQASPRDTRLSRAVFHTYIQPAATQERAAELLDLPFSTYRRHLKQGLQRIAELLWKLEVDLPVSKK